MVVSGKDGGSHGRKVASVPPLLLQGTMVVTAAQPAKVLVSEFQKVTSKETLAQSRKQLLGESRSTAGNMFNEEKDERKPPHFQKKTH